MERMMDCASVKVGWEGQEGHIVCGCCYSGCFLRESVIIKQLTELNHILLGKNNIIRKAESYVLSLKSQWGSYWEVKHEGTKMKINIKIWFLLYPQSGRGGEMGVCVHVCV